MRAAAARLPEPTSPTTSTGTSFCDSSRITASTVRMPELTLSNHTGSAPFLKIRLPASTSERLVSMLILFREQRGRVSEEDRVNTEHTHCQPYQPPSQALQAINIL